jgi:hypothetical protein
VSNAKATFKQQLKEGSALERVARNAARQSKELGIKKDKWLSIQVDLQPSLVAGATSLEPTSIEKVDTMAFTQIALLRLKELGIGSRQ